MVRLLFRLEPDVFIQFHPPRITVYAGERELAARIAKEWFAAYGKPRLEEPEAPRFNLLTFRRGEVDCEPVRLTRSYLLDDADLPLHYGDGFADWEQRFLQLLTTRASGVSILRGAPGTGKTSYLRHLVFKLRKTHRFFCLPVTHHQALSSPGMTDFWADQHQSHPALRNVVVLEDAEALLAERHDGNRASLSNLLNVADGLVGEFLRIQLICIVNCALDRLDPALTRAGRLLACREFRRLTRAEAHRLATAKCLVLPGQADYSFAEIYNGTEQLGVEVNERKVGFAS